MTNWADVIKFAANGLSGERRQEAIQEMWGTLLEMQADGITDEVELARGITGGHRGKSSGHLWYGRRGQRRGVAQAIPESTMTPPGEDGDDFDLWEVVNVGVGEAQSYDFCCGKIPAYAEDMLDMARGVWRDKVDLSGNALDKSEIDKIVRLAKLVKDPQPDDEPSPCWTYRAPPRDPDKCDISLFQDENDDALWNEWVSAASLTEDARRPEMYKDIVPPAPSVERIPMESWTLLRSTWGKDRFASDVVSVINHACPSSQSDTAWFVRFIAGHLVNEEIVDQHDDVYEVVLPHLGLGWLLDDMSEMDSGEDILNDFGGGVLDRILWGKEDQLGLDVKPVGDMSWPGEATLDDIDIKTTGTKAWETVAFKRAVVRSIISGGNRDDWQIAGWSAYNAIRWFDCPHACIAFSKAMKQLMESENKPAWRAIVAAANAAGAEVASEEKLDIVRSIENGIILCNTFFSWDDAVCLAWRLDSIPEVQPVMPVEHERSQSEIIARKAYEESLRGRNRGNRMNSNQVTAISRSGARIGGKLVPWASIPTGTDFGQFASAAERMT